MQNVGSLRFKDCAWASQPTLPMQNGLPLGEGAPVRTLGRMRGPVPITLPLRSSRRGGTPGPPVKPSPSKGEGGTRSVTDEGAFLTCAIPGGSPKGLPYPKLEGLLETRRGGADSLYQGEMARRARGDRDRCRVNARRMRGTPPIILSFRPIRRGGPACGFSVGAGAPTRPLSPHRTT